MPLAQLLRKLSALERAAEPSDRGAEEVRDDTTRGDVKLAYQAILADGTWQRHTRACCGRCSRMRGYTETDALSKLLQRSSMECDGLPCFGVTAEVVSQPGLQHRSCDSLGSSSSAQAVFDVIAASAPSQHRRHTSPPPASSSLRKVSPEHISSARSGSYTLLQHHTSIALDSATASCISCLCCRHPQKAQCANIL